MCMGGASPSGIDGRLEWRHWWVSNDSKSGGSRCWMEPPSTVEVERPVVATPLGVAPKQRHGDFTRAI